MTILGISGSLRHDSYNSMLLRNVPLELELWDGLKEIPPYDEDDDVEPAPPAVARMRAAVAGADAIVFATPEYNASVPGQLKNAVDWLSRPRVGAALQNKPVAVIGASTGAFGAVWAQAELRKVLATAGARVVDAEVAVGHAHDALRRGRRAPRREPEGAAAGGGRHAARRASGTRAGRRVAGRLLRIPRGRRLAPHRTADRRGHATAARAAARARGRRCRPAPPRRRRRGERRGQHRLRVRRDGGRDPRGRGGRPCAARGARRRGRRSRSTAGTISSSGGRTSPCRCRRRRPSARPSASASRRPRRPSRAQSGRALWEVRLELPSHGRTRELADRLEQEGLHVIRRWTFLLVGADSEDDARELAERLRSEAPDAAIQVEPSGEMIAEVAPGNPFAIFGGLAG